uniref:Uncharacterized protein n=1 Tax=Arundo donax TaxID=35708 RepID=A0A0A8ZYF8_ARUDO
MDIFHVLNLCRLTFIHLYSFLHRSLDFSEHL